MRPRQYRPEYTPPGKDSARSIANAQMMLCGAVSVDQFTPEKFAHMHRLSPAKAKMMIYAEQQRRAARHAF